MPKKHKVEVELHPWRTPNFARGKEDDNAFPVSALSPKALSDLCDRFRRDVFEKAGKKDPMQTPFAKARQVYDDCNYGALEGES